MFVSFIGTLQRQGNNSTTFNLTLWFSRFSLTTCYEHRELRAQNTDSYMPNFNLTSASLSDMPCQERQPAATAAVQPVP